MRLINNYTVVFRFTEACEGLVNALVRNCANEIAWHYKTTREFTGHRIVITFSDVIVPPQIVTGASVDTDWEAYAKFCTDNDMTGWNGHGHSHVNMAVFSSGTDDSYQSDQINQMQNGYYAFTIHNKKGDLFCRYYDLDLGVMFDNDEIEVEYLKDATYTEIAQELIAQNVKVKTVPVVQIPTIDADGFEYDTSWWYTPKKGQTNECETLLQDIRNTQKKRKGKNH